MKKVFSILVCLSMLFLNSCDNKQSNKYNTFTYTHFASGGAKEMYDALIIFEQSNSTFTSYQIAYSSCTCRNTIVNYYHVCYVELLNNTANPELSKIRYITFGENMGLWGDSNPNYYIAEYTQEYMDEHLVKPLIGVTKSEIDEFSEYGKYIDVIDADAVAGASVSSSNLLSMLQGLFKYHIEHYY